MQRIVQVIAFEVEGTRYAVEVERFVEVLPRVRTTPLDGAPPFVEGLFVYRERPCVAVSMRARIGGTARPPRLDDHFLVVRGATRTLALVVDAVLGDEHVDATRAELPPVPSARVKSVVALPSGMLLVQDVEALLSAEEEAALAQSLDEALVR